MPACVCAKFCPTLCNPMDCSPPGSSVHGILQARVLEWVPCSPPGDLPNPGIKPRAPALAGRFFTTEPPGKPLLLARSSRMHRKPRELPKRLMLTTWQCSARVWQGRFPHSCLALLFWGWKESVWGSRGCLFSECFNKSLF